MRFDSCEDGEHIKLLPERPEPRLLQQAAAVALVMAACSEKILAEQVASQLVFVVSLSLESEGTDRIIESMEMRRETARELGESLRDIDEEDTHDVAGARNLGGQILAELDAQEIVLDIPPSLPANFA